MKKMTKTASALLGGGVGPHTEASGSDHRHF